MRDAPVEPLMRYVECRQHGQSWSKTCDECGDCLDAMGARRPLKTRRLITFGAVALTVASAIETVAGIGAAVIIIGEAAKIWDLL